jgi:hypothetical protein
LTSTGSTNGEKLLAAQQGNGLRVEAGEFFEDPEGLYPAGAVLPGPVAKLAGPPTRSG